MICPHCSARLSYKQRTDRTCSNCHSLFALEPRWSPLRLHDRRLHQLARELSERGTLAYTDTQLWYAASRRHLRPVRGVAHTPDHDWIVVVVLTGAAAAAYGVFRHVVLLGLLALLVLAAVAGISQQLPRWRHELPQRLRHPLRRPAPRIIWSAAEPPVPLWQFREWLAGWTQVYGQPPVGMLPASSTTASEQVPVLDATRKARAVLLCADRDAVTCLTANGVVERLALRVVRDPGELATCAPELPLLVLRDASAPGEHLVAAARRVAGSRVTDLGIRVGQAMQSRLPALRVPRAEVDSAALAEPRADPRLGAEESQWLTDGLVSPVAAVRPRRLIAHVERSVDQVLTDHADRATAAAVGFLTWPAE